MIKFKSLNRSKDFLKILKKKRLNTKYFTIYFDKNLIGWQDKILFVPLIVPLKTPSSSKLSIKYSEQVGRYLQLDGK